MPSHGLPASLPSGSTACDSTRDNTCIPIVSGAGLVDPSVAPAADHRPNFLGAIKLRNAQAAEIFGRCDRAMEPNCVGVEGANLW